MFKKGFKTPETFIEDLKNSSLWSAKLKNDCLAQEIFLAIRYDYIDFYHKGGCLFSYGRKKFLTHVKYAATVSKGERPYLTTSELKKFRLAHDFLSSYDRLKENCAKTSGIEATGISALYHKHSYLADDDIVVLDTKAAFQSLEEEKATDRIDIVLLDKRDGQLQFVKARHYANPEIWARKGEPRIIEQVARYESQIAYRRDEIIQGYSAYISLLNTIFRLSLPVPTALDEKVTLLIFGFDHDQKTGRLKTHITGNPNAEGSKPGSASYTGIKLYPKGDITDVKMQHLWNARVKK